MIEISNILREFKLIQEGEILANPSVASAYFVPLRLVRHSDGRKTPSGRTLSHARLRLTHLGYDVDFILIDSNSRDIEESLRAGLISSFPDSVRNAFFSDQSKACTVWVDFKVAPDEAGLLRIRLHLENFATRFELPPFEVVPIGEANTATKFEILAVLRQIAPARDRDIAASLVARGNDVPSADWLRRQLESMGKSNHLVRRADGAYVLTGKAIVSLGTQKGRNSPDVRRILALARRNA